MSESISEKLAPTISSAAVQPLLQYCHVQGIPSTELTERDPDTLLRQETRLPYSEVVEMWNRAKEITNDPILGLHVGNRLQPKYLGIVGHVISNCPTLAHALAAVGKFNRLLYDRDLITITHDGEHTRLSLDNYPIERDMVEIERPVAEFAVAGIVTCAINLVDNDASGSIVHASFRYSRPPEECMEAYHEFFGDSISFDQNDNHLVIHRDLLNYPITCADPQLLILFTQKAEQEQRATNSASIVQRVVVEIRQGMRGSMPTITEVASALNVSRATLQRRLAVHDLSYSELSDNIRREMAFELLAGDASLIEITFLLGYSEPSAFYHAFKRWTGTSPQRYRKENQA